MLLGKLEVGFPWGVLLVTDEGSTELVPEWSSEEEQLSHGESVAVLRVMDKHEGDVLVRVWDDANAANGNVVFRGSLKVDSGVLRVSDALGEAVLAIPTAAGWTDVAIYTDAASEPTRVDLVVAAPASSGSANGGTGDQDVPYRVARFSAGPSTNAQRTQYRGPRS